MFLRLVRECEPTLLRVARRLCVGRDDADDVVQDAVVAAYRAFMAGRFEEMENFRPWMLRILRNTFLQAERKRKRWVLPGRDALEALTDVRPAQPPPSSLDAELDRALLALSDEQRICIELVYFEELEYEEAALVLQVPVGTVRSRLARARYSMYASLVEAQRGRFRT